ncbi:MAG: T9SS type A sorting domain-containing protein [Saprospiraceae bacterium]
MKYLFVICWVFITFYHVTGQNFSQFDIEFIKDSKSLAYPLAGGLNTPQLSAVDLNDDGLDDLHVFDRVGEVQLTFLSDGTKYYYAPEYISYFPKIKNWMLLRDYNGDGIMDLFGYSDVPGVDGVLVYTGYYENGHIAFKRFNFNWFYNILSFQLSSGSRTQLYVSKIDYPAIDDVDCDGDLDILTFNVAGGYVEMYANRSVERGFGRDSLIFNLVEDCWGGFYESGFTKKVDLSPTKDGCVRNLDEVIMRHAGSTLLTFDADNDGDKELILGDLSFNNFNYLINGGDCQNAWMVQQDTAFPNYNVPLDLPIFPAAFYLDLNFDGKKDLAAAPSSTFISEDQEVIWRYENVGSNALPRFELRQRDFLVNEMIDLGTGASPTFVDYNADGLLDLVVGNTYIYNPGNQRDARLFLFENIGTVSNPKFNLVSEDYLGMSQFSTNTNHFTPAFGDLDGDGDLDVLVGEEQGRLFYAENTAGAGNPLIFSEWQYDFRGIDVGISSAPFIADVNRDGLPDLLIGERNGNINYFQNIGNQSNPLFNADPTVLPNTDRFGRIDARVPGFVAGYSAPVLVAVRGSYRLLTGTDVGQIEMYNNIEENFYNALMPESEQLGNVLVGAQSRVALADLNNDGLLEMMVGNQRGGLSAFKTNLPSGGTVPVTEPASAFDVKIMPNPAATTLQIAVNAYHNTPKTLQLFNAAGQLVLQQSWTDSYISLNVSNLPEGVYFVKIELQGQVASEKVIIIR